MSYPGSSSLAQETQDKILSTFAQTLDLAKTGRLQEAALGCDFILKMDRQFEPARDLQQRLEGSEGPIDVSGLPIEPDPEPAVDVPPEAVDVPPEATQEVFELDLSKESSGLEAEGAGLTESADLPALEPSDSLDASAEIDLTAEGASLATAPPSIASESGGDRIQELLDEGQQSLDTGEYQAAIDAWSRIFLIDIDHDEASRRIESARQLKAEQERRVDEIMHEATDLLGAGKKEEARSAFERVLEAHPGHLAAREYLQQLDAPDAEQPPVAGGLKPPPAPTETGSLDDGLSELDEDVLGAPPSGAAKTLRPAASAGSRSGSAKPDRSFLRVGIGVFAVLLVGGWLLFQNWGRLFPNTTEAVAAPRSPSVIQMANRQHLDGQTELALERLRALPRAHAEYQQAQTLIESWSTEVVTEEEPAPSEPGLDEGESQRREGLIERARRLYDEREYFRAAKAFRAASQVAPLEGAVNDLYEDTKQQLLPIASQISLFQQREWQMLLPTLWRRREDEPSNRDVTRLLIDSYFNLGIRALRRGEPELAQERFSEMIGLGARDALGERLLLFSLSYSLYPEDLLFQIYVDQLQYRQ